MAKLPKCCGCIYCNMWKSVSVCEIYPQEIPKDVFFEDKECDKYKLDIPVADENLPKAKGR